jgi:hypothetical protein
LTSIKRFDKSAYMEHFILRMTAAFAAFVFGFLFAIIPYFVVSRLYGMSLVPDHQYAAVGLINTLLLAWLFERMIARWEKNKKE